MEERIVKKQMLNKVKEYCRKENLLEPGMSVVIGVSGGADSVCLLTLLGMLRAEWELSLYAVHVHHGIRGKEADEDMRYTESVCRKLNINMVSFRLDIPAAAREQKLSLEEAGRKERYRCFEKVRKQVNADCIAVAHHRDDLTETSLMNLFRGSGIRGVAGISPKRGKIIRPLLCVGRQDIEEWLREQGISWRTDSTNNDEGYYRNRIRHCLLPELKSSYNERAAEHIASFAHDLQEADAYLEGEAKRLLSECTQQETSKLYRLLSQETSVSIPINLLKTQPHLLSVYVLREALQRLGARWKDISRTHIEAILQLTHATGGKTVQLPFGLCARLEYQSILLEYSGEKKKNVSFSVIYRLDSSKNQKKVCENDCINRFDYDKIRGSIELRSRRPKDRICIAADGKSKRLKDYLIDVKMPAALRDSWPLLACGEWILWIPGYRTAQNCKVEPDTKRILEVELKVNTGRIKDEG